jgi:multidrug efflux pump subunit AcrA (membrane-fusion protein)
MSSDGSVALTAAQVREFGITFASAEVRPLVAETRTVGVVTVDETRIAQVTARVNGFAERVYADFTGRMVQRGAPLLELYSPELVAAEQELLLAKQFQRTTGRGDIPGAVPDSTSLVGAAQRRLELWDIPSSQIHDILRTGQIRRTLTLRSPATGTIVQKSIVQGQAVTAGMPLYTIADLSTVWIEARLREADAGAVRLGTTATIELSAYPGRSFTGVVRYIYPTLDSVTRAVRARITVMNPDGMLKPGMYATIRLSTPSRRALTVPSDAVLRTGTRNIVFVDMGQGRLLPQVVELGRIAGDLTEILTGLEPGQRVVTSAQFLLDSESNLGDVMRAMMSQTGSSDMGTMDNMDNMDNMGDMNGPSGRNDMQMQNMQMQKPMQNMPGMSMPQGR